MKIIIHRVAGSVAFLTIVAFWLSTILSELFGSEEVIVTVKTSIPWGFIILIPALAATGGSGFKLAQGRKNELIGSKAKRMPFIAANGVLVLVPAAFYLAHKANTGVFDNTFYWVQSLELLAGGLNIALLGLNIRDGLKLNGRLS